MRHPLLDHPLWPKIRGFVHASLGTQNQFHLNIKKMPPGLRNQAMAIVVSCHCGVPFHPIRASYGNTALEVYATGERTNGHKHCSYGTIAIGLKASIYLDIIQSTEVVHR